ncbi:MAG: hypothetical protein WKF37_03765, partial [Bryobacteraceae bacterium]
MPTPLCEPTVQFIGERRGVGDSYEQRTIRPYSAADLSEAVLQTLKMLEAVISDDRVYPRSPKWQVPGVTLHNDFARTCSGNVP